MSVTRPDCDRSLPRLALTAGEPAGIGAELLVRLAATDLAADLVAIGDPRLLEAAARMLDVPLHLQPFDGTPVAARTPHALRVLAVETAQAVAPGRLDPRNAPYVLDMLARAADGTQDGTFDAIVTAPVHKGVINDAGIPFTGHTEFFAAHAGCDVVMMLVAEAGGFDLRVALATTHLPLANVPAAITRDGIMKCLRIVHRDLVRHFGIAHPRIAVLGLNPHAGEGGHLGREEIERIAPAIDLLRAEGMDLHGPLPADTALIPRHARGFDAILAMYHDQGLPVLKYAGFGHAVNVTLGLPWVRTSVDHGTALDLAGKGIADAGSLFAASRLALSLAQTRRQASA